MFSDQHAHEHTNGHKWICHLNNAAQDVKMITASGWNYSKNTCATRMIGPSVFINSISFASHILLWNLIKSFILVSSDNKLLSFWFTMHYWQTLDVFNLVLEQQLLLFYPFIQASVLWSTLHDKPVHSQLLKPFKTTILLFFNPRGSY